MWVTCTDNSTLDYRDSIESVKSSSVISPNYKPRRHPWLSLPPSPQVSSGHNPTGSFSFSKLFYYFIIDKLLCAHCAVQAMEWYHYLWRSLNTLSQPHSSFLLRRVLLSWGGWVRKEFGSGSEFRFCTCWIWRAWGVCPGLVWGKGGTWVQNVMKNSQHLASARLAFGESRANQQASGWMCGTGGHREKWAGSGFLGSSLCGPSKRRFNRTEEDNEEARKDILMRPWEGELLRVRDKPTTKPLGAHVDPLHQQGASSTQKQTKTEPREDRIKVWFLFQGGNKWLDTAERWLSWNHIA